MTIKKLNEDEKNLLTRWGTLIITETGEKYFYLPFWFRQIDNENFEMIAFENLPTEVIDDIKAYEKSKD